MVATGSKKPACRSFLRDTAGQLRRLSAMSAPQSIGNPERDVEQDIFSETFRRYLMWRCSRKGMNWHDAEDIVSRLQCRLYESWAAGEIRGKSGPTAVALAIQKLDWLISNARRDTRRRLKRVYGSANGKSRGEFVAHSNLQMIEMTDEVRHMFEVAEQKLCGLQLEIFRLLSTGLMQKEISPILGTKKSSTSKHAILAIEWMKHHMRPHMQKVA